VGTLNLDGINWVIVGENHLGTCVFTQPRPNSDIHVISFDR
jgi:hypothetical protein